MSGGRAARRPVGGDPAHSTLVPRFAGLGPDSRRAAHGGHKEVPGGAVAGGPSRRSIPATRGYSCSSRSAASAGLASSRDEGRRRSPGRAWALIQHLVAWTTTAARGLPALRDGASTERNRCRSSREGGEGGHLRAEPPGRRASRTARHVKKRATTACRVAGGGGRRCPWAGGRCVRGEVSDRQRAWPCGQATTESGVTPVATERWVLRWRKEGAQGQDTRW